MEYTFVKHAFEPVWNRESERLILGSLPSVKSREQGFYYGHPQNRFWKVVAGLFDWEEPRTVDEKKKMLLKNHTAIWDVIDSCEIKGSSDSSIRSVTAADIGSLIEQSGITKIYANGKTAAKLYNKYVYPETGVPVIELPSTSPANAAYSLERLLEIWEERIQ